MHCIATVQSAYLPPVFELRWYKGLDSSDACDAIALGFIVERVPRGEGCRNLRAKPRRRSSNPMRQQKLAIWVWKERQLLSVCKQRQLRTVLASKGASDAMLWATNTQEMLV